MGLIDDLQPGPVALDTAVFIYFIEEDRRFLDIVKPVFTAMDRGVLEGTTSGLTLLAQVTHEHPPLDDLRPHKLRKC